MSDKTGAISDQMASSSAHVTRVFFEGVERTKQWVLNAEIRHLLAASNFAQLYNRAYEAKVRLEKDGLFDRVAVLIDVDKSQTPTPDGYEVTFVAQEAQIGTGGINMEVSNRGEKSLRLTGHGANIFGAGESATAEASRGSHSSSTLRFSLGKPLINWRDARLGASVWHQHAVWSWAQFGATETGASLDLTHWPITNTICHQLRYLVAGRHVTPSGPETPFSLRRFAGANLKSSLESTVSLDTRDDVMVARQGVLLRLVNELAGLGGDAKFWRKEVLAQLSTTLPLFDVTLSAGGRATLITPLGPLRSPEAAEQQSPLHVLDRTFLGGPTDLRGFDFNGAGPEQDGSFLGGSASWCLVGHLYKQLRPASFLWAHGFVGAGNLAPVRAESDWRDLTSQPRASAGLGLVVRLGGLARMEFNYVWPLWTRPGDAVRSGFQFGLGLHFI